MSALNPVFHITNAMTDDLSRIDQAKGFLDATKLSEEWIGAMERRALVREAHFTTHIEDSQFQLVHIHPFRDGNGRTSRLLSTLCLYRAGYDFKRLFTISEFYDRDRPAFYRAIQNVREQNMNMTGWLEYFMRGLATQLIEVKDRGQRVIQTGLIAKKHGLTARQQVLVSFLLEHGEAYFADLEAACPDVPRRTLQRDIQGLVNTGILDAKGATNSLRYALKNSTL